MSARNTSRMRVWGHRGGPDDDTSYRVGSGPANADNLQTSVRVMNELHDLAGGDPAAAAVLSPRTFEPPSNIKKMIDAMKPAKYMKSAEGRDYKKFSKGMCDEMVAMGDKFATSKTIYMKGGHALPKPLMFEGGGGQRVIRSITTEGGHALLKPLMFKGGGVKMVTKIKLYAAGVFGGGQDARNETNRKKLPRHNALSPSRCPEDCMGGDIVEGPVVFYRVAPHVVQNYARGPGQPALGRSVVAEQ